MSSSGKKGPSLVYWLGSSLYLNITNRCSNSCYFCIRKFRKGVGGFNLTLEKEPTPEEVISELQEVINKKSWNEIVFCGFGEPLERLDCVLEVAMWTKKYYGKPVKLRVDTNGHGYLLNRGREVLRELRQAGINKMSISLNAHNKQLYDQICSPQFENAFEHVLQFIEKAKEGFEVEVTAVAIPEIDLATMEKMAKELRVKFRIREYFPRL